MSQTAARWFLLVTYIILLVVNSYVLFQGVR